MMLNLGAIITLLFTALRLIGTVRWSWFWIFLPVNVGYLCDITVRIVAVRMYRKQMRLKAKLNAEYGKAVMLNDF